MRVTMFFGVSAGAAATVAKLNALGASAYLFVVVDYCRLNRFFGKNRAVNFYGRKSVRELR